ncbi:SpoIIE family protein phosphatase [Kitasatospora sp. NPDC094015]|uniref:SpoIIE family protein phosphatase n=1 Tax=Kitasatospora sp. NPDC094015 TaxID=3155205 RepID=UPI003318414E
MHSEAPGGDDRLRAPAPAGGGDPELLRGALDRAPTGIAVADARLRWLYANPAFEQAAGLRPGALVGRSVDASPLAAAAPLLAAALAGPGGDGTVTGPLPSAGDGSGGAAPELRLSCRRVLVQGRTVGVVAVIAEVGAVSSGGAAPGGGAPHGAAPDGGADRAAARLAVVKAAAGEIGTTLDPDRTCAELAQFATAEGLADIAAVDLLPIGRTPHIGDGVRLHRAALAGDPVGGSGAPAPARPGENVRHRDGSPTAEALATGRPVSVDLAATGPAAADPVGYRAAGVRYLLVVPLTARGRTLGVLHLGRLRADRAGFTELDLTLIGDLAAHAALAIDNAQRYTRSQHVALDLQRALLAEPANPHPNLELATRYLPSGSSSVVGGDWYETVRLPFGRTLLVIGDVMGHGVEAAVDMSTYRSMLRYTASMDLPPHRILRQLDTLITENDSSRPATCLLALADPARNRWTLASAGHLPPALITPDHPTELLRLPTGPPLGTGLADYEQTTRTLTPGQTLLLYTDGLVERRGEDIDVSLARLADLPLPAAGDLDDLLDAVLHQLSARPAEDDTALLAARPRPR